MVPVLELPADVSEGLPAVVGELALLDASVLFNSLTRAVASDERGMLRALM